MNTAAMPTHAIDLLEQAVHGIDDRDHRVAVQRLHTLLANLERSGGDVASSADTHFHFRLAMTITALLLDEGFEIQLEEYRLLCASNHAIATVFACTPFQHADHVIAQLADVSDIRNIRFGDRNRLMKSLLVYSLYGTFEFDLHQLAEQFPELIAPLVLAQLGYDLYSRPRVEDRMNRLLQQDWSVLAQATPDLPMVVSTSRAWMNCSYASTPHKHEVKRYLNSMIRNGIAARGLNIRRIEHDPGAERPVIVVPVELFNSRHAMFRCFSRVIDRLRADFRVIGVSPHHCIDEDACKIFDETILFDPGEIILDMQPLIDRIQKHEPAIIYYPSLGMANYSLILANLRLAPVQCFTLGHPASSFIDSIDYAIVQQQDYTTSDVYSEKVILTGNDTSPTINMIRESIPAPEPRIAPDTIEIAVTSKHMKINHSFLQVCQRIAEHASRPVHFRFFPGVRGYLYEFVRHEIRRMLPTATVYPTTDYDTYIGNLAACDVRLGTFPFGGANTNMDCFGLGIPFVILDGEQPHSHSDAAQLVQAELPSWLITKDVEQYIGAALKLIDEEPVRLDISRRMLQLYDHDFFNKTQHDDSIVFHQTMRWILENHEALQASEQRAWTLVQQTEPA